MPVVRILAFIASLYGAAGCALLCMPTPPGRPIPHDWNKTIASRLLPDDDEVFVYMNDLCEMNVYGQATFDQEIEVLRNSEFIAIVRITDVQSELIDNGSWVYTRMSADVETLLQSPPWKTLDRSIELGFNDGVTKIGNVIVNAGIVPQFAEGERYLMFPFWQPGINLLYPAYPFHINPQGQLEGMPTNAGVVPAFGAHLIGHNVADIVGKLSK
jgi:hypothetical protein